MTALGVPALPTNWEELALLPENGKKIEQALTLLQTTLPGRWNYENLDVDKILQKMVPRKNKNAVYINGLRIFQRVVPPIPAPRQYRPSTLPRSSLRACWRRTRGCLMTLIA